MKHGTALVALSAATLSLLLCPAASAAESADWPWYGDGAAAAGPIAQRSFYDDWIANKLSIGLRLSKNSLTDAERPGNYEEDFVGAIYKLDDVDDVFVAPELRYEPIRFVRLVLGWDSVAGKTRNFNTENHHSDGNATMSGPVLLAEGVCPVYEDYLSFHAGIGAAFGHGGFDHVTWWHLGYSSRDSWEYYGSPNKLRGNHYRQIYVDDEVGLVLSGGVSCRPFERLEIDLSVRYIRLEPDCHWGYLYKSGFDEHQTGEFTLDHLSVSLLAAYVF